MPYINHDRHFCTLGLDDDVLKDVRDSGKRSYLRAIVVSRKNPRSHKYFRSITAYNVEKIRHANNKTWYVIHPFSIFQLVREIIMSLVYLVQLVQVPLILPFQRDLLFPYSSAVIDLICVLDVITNFFTGYVKSNTHEIVLDLNQTARKYVSTFFFPDFIAAFPFSFLYEISEKMFYLRSLSLLKIWFFRLLYANGSIILSVVNVSPRNIHITEFSILSSLLIHWSVTSEYFIPYLLFSKHDLAERSDSWISLANLTGAGIADHYARAWYRSWGMLVRLGFGRADPHTVEDILMSMARIVLGCFYFLYLLDEVVTLRYLTARKAKYEVVISQLKSFMRQKQLPERLQKRILFFYEYRYQKSHFKENAILASISLRLRDEIRMHSCRRLVENSLLFKNLPIESLGRLSRYLKPDFFLPNDVIVKSGVKSDCMYFLSSGTVAIVMRNGAEMVHLTDGSFFGETEVLLEDVPRVANVVAVEVCEVLRLDKRDFAVLARRHDELLEAMRDIAFRRLQEMMRGGRSRFLSSHI